MTVRPLAGPRRWRPITPRERGDITHTRPLVKWQLWVPWEWEYGPRRRMKLFEGHWQYSSRRPVNVIPLIGGLPKPKAGARAACQARRPAVCLTDLCKISLRRMGRGASQWGPQHTERARTLNHKRRAGWPQQSYNRYCQASSVEGLQMHWRRTAPEPD
jgi:hypothetical protein